MQMHSRIALIPAYEPGDKLAELTEQLSLAGFQVLVVDDGSGEAFRPIFGKTSAYATVLTHETNKGKGQALKTGLSYIHENFPQDFVIVTLDSDGQHSVEDTIRVCDCAIRNKGALVLGCRSFKDGTPIRSWFGNTMTRLVYRISTGVSVSDTQTGLRAFGAEMIPVMLSVRGERYEYEMNVLLECSQKKVPIKEVAIKTIYFDNNSGSHFSTIKDSYRVYKEILKFAAASFVGFLVDYGLYSLLTVVTVGLGTAVSIPLSNVLARIVSSIVNYILNKRLVFNCRGKVVKTAVQYFVLAAVILAGNTLLLSYLTANLGVNRYAAKIIVEIAFFALSWFVQKFLIFRKKAPSDDNNDGRSGYFQ